MLNRYAPQQAYAGPALTGTVLVILLSTVSAPVAFWALAAFWLGLWAAAIYRQSTPARLARLRLGLRNSFAGRNARALAELSGWVWQRHCDTASGNALRAALTWRLFDTALLLATILPALVVVLVWAVAIPPLPAPDTPFPAAADWPARALSAAAFLAVLASLPAAQIAAAREGRLSRVARWIPQVTIALAFAITVAVAGLYTAALSAGLLGAVVFAAISAGKASPGGALAVSVSTTSLRPGPVFGAAAFGVSGAGAVSAILAFGAAAILTATSAFPAAAAILTIAVLLWVQFRLPPRGFRLVAVLFLVSGWLIWLLVRPWQGATPPQRGLFVVLATIPLVLALFDWLSCAATLALIRHGLARSCLARNCAINLVCTGGLCLALGAAITAALAAMNRMTGFAFVDLGLLSARPGFDFGNAPWLVLALTPALPLLLYVAPAALAAPCLLPTRLRTRASGMLERANVARMAAPMVVSLIWLAPLAGILCLIYAVTGPGARVLSGAAQTYLGLLARLAGWVCAC
ncbi:MAG: hypothetical protein LJE68_02365 [Rhodobacter sp.]|nr:hypothetical protein [Rhodobacter sp.]